jgi:hypothetical protein
MNRAILIVFLCGASAFAQPKLDTAADFQQFFASSDEGGVFALDAFFPVTAGMPSQVDSVEIQMVNAAGTTPTTRLYFTTP